MGKNLISQAGRRYPVVDGIPVLLIDDADQTFHVARSSLDRSRERLGAVDQRAPELYLETLGLCDEEKVQLVRLARGKLTKIDPVALMLLRATSGNSYSHLKGDPALAEYPIPNIDLPVAPGGKSWMSAAVGAAGVSLPEDAAIKWSASIHH